MSALLDKNISVDGYDCFVDSQRELKCSLTERFNKNIVAFKEYFPEIASFFESYTPSKNMEFISCQNGIPNLFFRDTNSFFYNTLDPICLCKEFINNYLKHPVNVSNFKTQDDFIGHIYDKYLNECLKYTDIDTRDKILFSDLDTIPVCVVTGVGLGYILGELFEKIPVSTLVIVEHDPDIFFASLHTFDWSQFLSYIFSEHLSIDIIIDNNASNCFYTLSEIVRKKGCYLSCSLLSIIHYENRFINDFSRLLQNKYALIPNLMGFYDDYLFGISHCIYALKTGKHFVTTAPNIEENIDYPVFLIGSGPSLDNDIDFVKRYQNKALVIACGSSLDSLYHTGIKPDFFANTERISEISSLLNSIHDKTYLENVILLSSDVCHPIVQNFFKKTLLFGKINEPFFKYFSLMFEQFKAVQPIEFMNPLVGNMGIASSLFLGFKKLYLFGFDNGKKTGTISIHSKHANFFKKNTFIEKREQYKLSYIVPGNFGGECLTNTYYGMSLENIERVIELFKNVSPKLQVVNCSDGALIENTTASHSKDLESIFINKPDLNKKAICNYIFEKKSKTINIPNDEINNVLSYNEFSNLCCTVIAKLEKMLSIENRHDLYISISELSIYLNTSSNPKEQFCKEMIESSMQAMLIEIFNASLLKKDFSVCMSVCRLIVAISIDFVRECDELFPYLPDYVLGEHRKYFEDGRVGRDMPHCKAPFFF